MQCQHDKLGQKMKRNKVMKNGLQIWSKWKQEL